MKKYKYVWWLRSAGDSYSKFVSLIYDNGAISNYYASANASFSLVCKI